MPSCPQCDGFTQRFNIGSSREYLDFVRQLIEIVNQGTFFSGVCQLSFAGYVQHSDPGRHHLSRLSVPYVRDAHFTFLPIPIMAAQVGEWVSYQNQLVIQQNRTKILPSLQYSPESTAFAIIGIRPVSPNLCL